MISIYNEGSIKAATRFMASAENKQPIYEVAISLKYLGFPIKDVENEVKFRYTIKLNVPSDQFIRSNDSITHVSPGVMAEENETQPGALLTQYTSSQNEVFRLSPPIFEEFIFEQDINNVNDLNFNTLSVKSIITNCTKTNTRV